MSWGVGWTVGSGGRIWEGVVECRAEGTAGHAGVEDGVGRGDVSKGSVRRLERSLERLKKG